MIINTGDLQLERALQNLSRLFENDAVEFWQNRFVRVRRMPGASKIFKRIADAPHKAQLRDYLAEIKYCLIFSGLEFLVEIEPFGKIGPDLQISRDKHNAYVEITRFRQIYQGPLESTPSDCRPLPYGDPTRDTNKAYDKILKKFRQVVNGESIIAIWNDEKDLEEIEVKQAVYSLHKDAMRANIQLPTGLSFVLYGSDWIILDGNKQLHCFPLRTIHEPHQLKWISELEASTVKEVIERALSQ